MRLKNRVLAMGLNSFRISFLIVIISFSCNIVHSQTPDPTITTLFQNSCKVYDAMRLPGGIYLDAMAINTNAKPAGLAANGVGLISLCIADAMYKKTGDAINWDSGAESKALETINEWIRLKNTPGAVNVNGLFHRYFRPADGGWVWVTEHSTIDNAILATGFLFCKNYFHNNTEIVSKTTILLNSMDFTAAIPSTGDQMYMILDDNGAGSALTTPFNEYMVLAWWAKNSNPSFPGYDRAQTYWTNIFSDATKLPKFNYPEGNPTLSSATTFAQSSFQIQFCYYYCHYFSNNANYMTFFSNQALADRTWWQNTTGQQVAWGCGAGEIPGGDYSADAVNNNPKKLVSPHIIAGFSPVYAGSKDDLIALYASGTGKAVYKIPGTERELLWRYYFVPNTKRASFVQAVDFSTMLYGLAALPEYLGTGFFSRYNDFNFDPSTSAVDMKESNDYLDIYPNPLKDQTKLEFELRNKAVVKITIYSEDGQMIKQLVNQEMAAGKHSVQWNARNEDSTLVPQGTYFCRLLKDEKSLQTKKLIVIK